MKKLGYKFVILVSIFVTVFVLGGLSGCKDKKEPKSEIPIETSKLIEKAAEPAHITPEPTQNQQAAEVHPQPAPTESSDAKKHQYTIVVPDEVKKSWSGVKLQVIDKKDKKMSDVEIAVGNQYKIPQTNLNITVNQFLPDFRIDSITITSASNKPNNPAVKVTITDGGTQLFDGWIFARFPNAHPFNHDRYALSLVNGIGIKKK
ncbi:MAG: DUF2155 domain-containing protein [Nitrospirae bacterium]|nr:DUF2155 domain-containing protein [Nitrospirota bacterium]